MKVNTRSHDAWGRSLFAPQGTPRPAKRQKRLTRAQRAFALHAQDIGTSATVTLLFEPESRYALVANELLERMPWYCGKNRGHWLCKSMDHVSVNVNPSTHISTFGKGLAQYLKKSGMPNFAAEIIGKSAAFGAGRLIGDFGTSQLVLGLRALGMLVCPNLERCPAQANVCKALLAPDAEAILKASLEKQP